MRCRFLPAAGLLAFAVCLATQPRDAVGCAIAPRAGEDADVSEETAFIVWDESARTEHFIRRATFVGNAYDFGFLVPTPSWPELAEADDNLYSELARITEPATEQHEVTNWGLGCSMASAPKSATPDTTPGGVVVLEQKRVGNLDASVLKFRGDKSQQPEDAADELLSWLNRNGYAVRPDLSAWLAPYIQNQWIITAFKIGGQPAGDTQAARPKEVGVKATTVRMSFKTDRPFYPYREPASERAEPDHKPRLLRVYVAARQRVAGKLGSSSTAWPGQTVWANTLADAERKNLIEKANLPTGSASGKWWMTEFEDRSSPRLGTDEVYFEPSADQSTVARPPRVVMIYTRPWWFVPLVYGLPTLALGGGILYLIRRNSSPPRPPITDI